MQLDGNVHVANVPETSAPPARTQLSEPVTESGVSAEMLRLREENSALRQAVEAAGLPLPPECQQRQQQQPQQLREQETPSAAARCSAAGNGRRCQRRGCRSCCDTNHTHWFTPIGTSVTARATVMPLAPYDDELPPRNEAGNSAEGTARNESRTTAAAPQQTEVGYTTQGVRVGDRLYPFPKPKYLLQLIKLCESKHNDPGALPLLRLLTKKRYQHAKEISENLGALAAMRAAVDDAPGLPSWFELTRSETPVRIYVPGDGRRPYAAATVCLHTPSHWRVWSIDPVMEEMYALDAEQMKKPAETNAILPGPDATDRLKSGGGGSSRHPLGTYCSRLTCVRGTTESFVLPDGEASGRGAGDMERDTLSIVLAVHSHCPLSEFVARICGTLLVVSLPCCGT